MLNENNKGYVLVFLTGVLWGTIGLFVSEMAKAGSSPELTSFLRMGLGLVIMLIIICFRHGVKSLMLDAKTFAVCIIIGVLCNGIYNICNSLSVIHNGVAVASVLMYTAPIFTALAARILFKERITRRKIFALILNIIGCILVVTGGNFVDFNINLRGVLYGIGAGFCYGMSPIAGKAAASSKRAEPVVIAAWSYFFAALFIFIFARPEFNILNFKILWIGFLFAVIPTAMAYILYYSALARVKSAARVPVVASIEPVTAALIGVLIYHESLGLANFAGIAIVIISIMI